MAFKVYLSPSTQENNKGLGNYGTEEIRMNQIADVVEKNLKLNGIIVYRNNPAMTLQQVVADSNSEKPDIHFAIHSNSGGGHGCECYCHKFGGKGEKLAQSTYSQVAAITPTSDRGVHQGFNFYGTGKHMYELAYTNAPAALIEVDFHDNPDDAAWIINNIEAIGTALAKGVLSYFGIAYNPCTDQYIAGVNVAYDKKYISDKSYWINKSSSDNSIKQLFINISKVG